MSLKDDSEVSNVRLDGGMVNSAVSGERRLLKGSFGRRKMMEKEVWRRKQEWERRRRGGRKQAV